MEHMTGIGLAAGSGTRIRPLSMKAKGYIRAKAAMPFLGRRILDWVMQDFHRQGVHEYVMVTKGKENRYQIKNMVGYGDALGATIRYSPVRFDQENTGSGDALLTNIDHYTIDGTAVVFPTDSIFEVDLSAMLAAHRRAGAVVTIAAALHPAARIANRYGLIEHDPDGRVHGFAEKPALAEICARFGLPAEKAERLTALPTNAGLYLIDCAALRAMGAHPAVGKMRTRHCDIGGDLLPWLVRYGAPVQVFAIERMGDLGNIASYLATMADVLHGGFASMAPLLGPGSEPGCEAMIDPTSLAMTDPHSGLSLAEKLERGLVTLRGPVRIGKYVQIATDVTLSACNIDDDCEIGPYTTIVRSSVGAGALIGSHSFLADSLTGCMVELRSSREHPVTLTGCVAIGDEVVVEGDVTLAGSVAIYPRLHVPSGARLLQPVEIESDEALHMLCRLPSRGEIMALPPLSRQSELTRTAALIGTAW